MTDHHADSFRQLLGLAFEVLRGQPHLADTDALVESLKHALISNLAHALIDDRLTDGPLIAPGRRWQVVATARDLIVEHPDTPITVTDLCRALWVSRRALQYCFQDVLGIGPAAFLRKVRLDGARRALKTAHSVTEAATLWGFWHFGRFAHDYRAMFGELPSEAFRRCHGTQRLA